MSQLACSGNVAFRERGSVLVAVVAFATLLAFAVGGFLGVARNVVNQEIVEINDDKAFLAAESGLLIGTRWLREPGNWMLYQENGNGYCGNIYEDVINDFNVAVTVTNQSNGDVQIQSTASGGGLPYSKRLRWNVRENNYGIFINDFTQAGKVGGGGVNNEWFDGPLHSNTPVYISSVSNGNVSVKFVNGKVSVYNKTELIPFMNGHWGDYGVSGVSQNDYNFGIYHHSAQPGQFWKLDPIFENNGSYTKFQHSKEKLYMSPVTTQTITLPQNQTSAPAAILYFFVDNGTTGKASYFYRSNNAPKCSTFNVNDQIIRIPNDVNVLGMVKGQVTVVTNSDCRINPVGDLAYYGYTPNYTQMNDYNNNNNYGLGDYGPLNDDVLALVSGGDIYFDLNKHTITVNGNAATLTPVPSQGQNKPEMVVTAQLFATEEGHGLRWDEKKNVNHYNYRLYALGTRAIDVYQESHNAQGGPGHEAFTFLYDTRFSTSGFQAPGVPSLRTASSSGGPFIVNTNWFEENIL